MRNASVMPLMMVLKAGSPSFARLDYSGPQTENFLEVIDWINQTYGEGFFLDPLNHPNRAAWEADLRTIPYRRVLDSPNQVFGSINPSGGFIPGTLDSPNTEEIRLGYSTRFGSSGFLKVDYVNRSFNDFYVSNTTLVTARPITETMI